VVQYVTRREFKLLQDMLNERHKAQQQGVSAALEAAEKAVNKAEAAAEKRFKSVNEFRKQLSDQAATFMPRAEYDTAHDALIEKMETATAARAREITELERRMTDAVRDLTTRADKAAGRDVGADEARGYARNSQTMRIQALGLAVAVLSVLATVLGIYAATH